MVAVAQICCWRSIAKFGQATVFIRYAALCLKYTAYMTRGRLHQLGVKMQILPVVSLLRDFFHFSFRVCLRRLSSNLSYADAWNTTTRARIDAGILANCCHYLARTSPMLFIRQKMYAIHILIQSQICYRTR